MKSEKGITLESLIIYIAVTVIVIGILTRVSTIFYNNMQYIDAEGKFAIEYQKLNASFLEDSKTIGTKILEINSDEKYVLFYNENTQEQIQYTFVGEGIYRNNARICQNVKATLKQEGNMLSILLEYTGSRNETITPKTLEYYIL